MKRVEAAGGAPQLICDTSGLSAGGQSAGTWGTDGTILFSAASTGIYRVPQSGGQPVRIAQPNAALGERSSFFPLVLPDGKHFLFHNQFMRRDDTGAFLMSFDGKEKKRLANSPYHFAYAPPLEKGMPGHLLFLRQDTLVAQPLAETFEPAGGAFPVAEDVGASVTYAFVTASFTGTLAYRSGGGATRQLTWYDRAGKALSNLGVPDDFNHVALSRDGARAAVMIQDQETGNRDIWLTDVARNTSTRFTFDEADDIDGRPAVAMSHSPRAGTARTRFTLRTPAARPAKRWCRSRRGTSANGLPTGRPMAGF